MLTTSDALFRIQVRFRAAWPSVRLLLCRRSRTGGRARAGAHGVGASASDTGRSKSPCRPRRASYRIGSVAGESVRPSARLGSRVLFFFCRRGGDGPKKMGMRERRVRERRMRSAVLCVCPPTDARDPRAPPGFWRPPDVLSLALAAAGRETLTNRATAYRYRRRRHVFLRGLLLL